MCRSLSGFKSNVRNKAALEGCIVEGYIATELVTFCSMYLNSAPTFHKEILMGLKGQEHNSTSIESQ
jgi:hypothetical protein